MTHQTGQVSSSSIFCRLSTSGFRSLLRFSIFSTHDTNAPSYCSRLPLLSLRYPLERATAVRGQSHREPERETDAVLTAEGLGTWKLELGAGSLAPVKYAGRGRPIGNSEREGSEAVAGRQPAERKCLGASAWAVCETGRYPIRGRREIFERRGRVFLPLFFGRAGCFVSSAPRAGGGGTSRPALSWRLGKKDLGRGGVRAALRTGGERSDQLLRASWAGLLKLQTQGSTVFLSD